MVVTMLRSTRSDAVAHSRGRSIADQASTAPNSSPQTTYGANPWSPGQAAVTSNVTTRATARKPMTRPLVGRNVSTTSSATGRPPVVCGPTGDATLCWPGEFPHRCSSGGDGTRRLRLGLLGDHPLGRLAPPVPPRSPRRRPGRRRGPGRDPRHAVDQDHGQGVRDRPRDPDGRPDHARGPGHPRQGARAGRQGDAPRPRRPDLPVDGGGLRLPRHGRDRQGGARRQRRQHRRGGHGLPERPSRDGHQARRHQGRRRGRRRRDRHGDRPGRVPVRPLPPGVRGDRARSARPAATRTSR